MANIKTHLNNIKSALFGKDVRESIHDGIDAINKEAESTTNRQINLENTFDQLVINAGNSNAEIVDARVKSDGTSYSKLGDRLDSVDSQLAQNEIKIKSNDMNFVNINKYLDEGYSFVKSIELSFNESQNVVVDFGEYEINEAGRTSWRTHQNQDRPSDGK